MLRRSFRSAIALTGATLIAGSLLLSGCGRSAVNPLAPDDESMSAPAGPGEDEDEGGVTFPGTSPMTGNTGNGSVATRPSTGGAAKPVTTTGGSTLRPLPKPTAIPAYKPPTGGGSDPEADMTSFVDLLGQFGYDAGARAEQNVRMQVAVVKRTPPKLLHWVQSENLGLTFGRRLQEMTKAGQKPVTYDQWKANGINLAARGEGVSYYVGRRALYRDILKDRYNDNASDAELVIYKRLNRTQWFVSYRANGQVDDFGFFAVDDWRNFLPIPAAFWQ